MSISCLCNVYKRVLPTEVLCTRIYYTGERSLVGVGSRDGVIRVYDFDSMSLYSSIVHTSKHELAMSAITTLTFYASNDIYVIGGNERGELFMSNINRESKPRLLSNKYKKPIRDLCVDEHCHALAIISADRTLQLWDLKEYKRRQIHRDATSCLTCVCFSKHGKWVATGCEGGQVRVYNIANGKIFQILNIVKNDVDASWNYSHGSTEHNITEKCQSKLAHDKCIANSVNSINSYITHLITCVQFHPERERIAASDITGHISIWDWQQSMLVQRCFIEQHSFVNAICLYADRLLVATEHLAHFYTISKPIEEEECIYMEWANMSNLHYHEKKEEILVSYYGESILFTGHLPLQHSNVESIDRDDEYEESLTDKDEKKDDNNTNNSCNNEIRKSKCDNKINTTTSTINTISTTVNNSSSDDSLPCNKLRSCNTFSEISENIQKQINCNDNVNMSISNPHNVHELLTLDNKVNANLPLSLSSVVPNVTTTEMAKEMEPDNVSLMNSKSYVDRNTKAKFSVANESNNKNNNADPLANTITTTYNANQANLTLHSKLVDTTNNVDTLDASSSEISVSNARPNSALATSIQTRNTDTSSQLAPSAKANEVCNGKSNQRELDLLAQLIWESDATCKILTERLEQLKMIREEWAEEPYEALEYLTGLHGDGWENIVCDFFTAIYKKELTLSIKMLPNVLELVVSLIHLSSTTIGNEHRYAALRILRIVIEEMQPKIEHRICEWNRLRSNHSTKRQKLSEKEQHQSNNHDCNKHSNYHTDYKNESMSNCNVSNMHTENNTNYVNDATMINSRKRIDNGTNDNSRQSSSTVMNGDYDNDELDSINDMDIVTLLKLREQLDECVRDAFQLINESDYYHEEIRHIMFDLQGLHTENM